MVFEKGNIFRKKTITHIVNENGCHICTSHARNHRGYPMMNKNYHNISIPRWLCQQKYGALKKGIVVRHTCDVPECINPDHLIPGTHQDNMNDMKQRGRQGKGEKNSQAKLTEKQVREILKSDKSYKELGIKYNVSSKCVEYIKLRRTWKHIKC